MRRVEVAVPELVETDTGPVTAPSGTRAVILFAETTVRLDAVVPSNAMALEPSNPEPLRVIVAPTTAVDGEKELSFGLTPNGPLVVVPPALATVIGPETAAAGTVVRSCVPPTSTLNPAPTGFVKPANLTLFVPLKVLPVRVTVVPIGPIESESVSIVGLTPRARPALVPPGVTTVREPVSAFLGRAPVVSCVAESMFAIGTCSEPSLNWVAPSRLEP